MAPGTTFDHSCMEMWLCDYSTLIAIFVTAPAGAPLNPSVTIIDSRTLSFIWEEPLEELRNGIIQQYHVNITEVDTGRQFQLVSSTTSTSVSSLHPYYTYRLSVSAFTIGGGPFSEPQMITTPEDGRVKWFSFTKVFYIHHVLYSPIWSPTNAYGYWDWSD